MQHFADGSRWSFGGEEFVFVEVSEAMSLEATLRALAITGAIRSSAVPGIIDICPAHASYMLRIDPDIIDLHTIPPILAEAHRAFADVGEVRLPSRLIEIPLLYRDPWTTETLLRFRDRHQSPDTDDITFVARVNGFWDVADYITAHSADPHLATFIGWVPANAECYQLVPSDRIMQAPKYLRPRTDTPVRALGTGGAFCNIYPVRGAGGFQLIGRSAVPVIDVHQSLPDFAQDFVLPKGGDIFKYRPITIDEYYDIRAQVEGGTYRYRIFPTVFDLTDFREDPVAHNRRLLAVLDD